MGEACRDVLRLDFDRRVKVEFHGTKITGDAGMLAYRELDDALCLTSTTDSELCDIRADKNTQYGLAASLRTNPRSKCVEKLPKCWLFGELTCLWAFMEGVSAILVNGRLETERLILILLTVLRAGIPIMESNGKSRLRVHWTRSSPGRVAAAAQGCAPDRAGLLARAKAYGTLQFSGARAAVTSKGSGFIGPVAERTYNPSGPAAI